MNEAATSNVPMIDEVGQRRNLGKECSRLEAVSNLVMLSANLVQVLRVINEELRMSTRSYPKGIDCIWLEYDREGNIGAFIAAGCGTVPEVMSLIRSRHAIPLEAGGGTGLGGPATRGLGLSVSRASNIQANKATGDAFRDKVADAMRSRGLTVETDVIKATPFGRLVIDIEVSKDGRILGGIDTKVGGSRYLPTPRATDEWLSQNECPVNMMRNR